jgi:hypothetical protein
MIRSTSPNKRFDDIINHKIANGELVAHNLIGIKLMSPRIWNDMYKGRMYHSLGGFINGKFYSWPMCGCGAKLELVVTEPKTK